MSHKKETIEILSGATVRYVIRRLFVKQVHFKSLVTTQDLESTQLQTETQIKVNVSHTQLSEDNYEVSLAVQALISGDKDVRSTFELRFEQAGVFGFRSPSSDELQRLLYVDCAEALFPYARELMDSLFIKASLHPLSMVMPDFKQLYFEMQTKQKRTLEPELWNEGDEGKGPITH